MIRKLLIALAASVAVTLPALALYNITQVSVGTSATQILPERGGRRAVTLINHGTTDVYIGTTNTVTSSNGALLTGTEGASIRIEGAVQAIYGIAGTAQAIGVIEEY